MIPLGGGATAGRGVWGGGLVGGGGDFLPPVGGAAVGACVGAGVGPTTGGVFRGGGLAGGGGDERYCSNVLPAPADEKSRWIGRHSIDNHYAPPKHTSKTSFKLS